ncbi:DMT family transporter [Rhodoligotrophos defluvii]|uniref:DMT family transporter n=1 Tax=Rhodoligotrophos defluvii TaxID=2561934 RepID=UPI001960C1EC|nr:EamA family transporter [Rhodoligotrophos defluvii]
MQEPAAASSEDHHPGRLPTAVLARIVLVMLLWALCFPLISIGLSMVSPFYFAAARAFVAGGGLLVLAMTLRRPLPSGCRTWALLVGIGITATSLGFFGMFLASQFVSPGFATVIANTQPLIAAVLASLLLGEHLRWRSRVGLLLGFAGIVLMTLPRLLADGGNAYSLGTAYIALAAIGVAVGNILMKRMADRVDPLMAMGWQLVFGGVPLLVAATVLEPLPSALWAPQFLIVLAVLGLLGTALAFYLWFSILQRSSLSRANAFSFLTPVFGVAIGMGFFDEGVSLVEFAGIGLVLLGMQQVTRG